MRQITATMCLALWAAMPVSAADPPKSQSSDADALDIADQATEQAGASQSWRLYAEGALSRSALRGAAPKADAARISLDLRYDAKIAPGWRAVVSDRLDVARSTDAQFDFDVNTLREAYLSWHVNPDEIVDIGRVNLRFGAALGYNPTDYFKAGALRSITSPDPASLRENRQGTVVLQGQKLWSGGSVTAVLSPRLGSTPSTSTFALDLGATNSRHRWLLSGSHKFTESFVPQLMLHGGEGAPTQVGLNVSGLVNSATVAYAEFSAGKGRSLIAQALESAEPERTQHRAAFGLTYTTAFNLSLTAEVEHNSAAPDRAQWSAFSNAASTNALRLLRTAQTEQDLPMRRALFFYASWRDMGARNLDLSAFVRREAETRSREQWIEARYHWKKADVALQWQHYSGGPASLYGAVPQPRRVEVSLRLFL